MLRSLWYLLTMPMTLKRLEARLQKLEHDARFVELQKWN